MSRAPNADRQIPTDSWVLKTATGRSPHGELVEPRGPGSLPPAYGLLAMPSWFDKLTMRATEAAAQVPTPADFGGAELQIQDTGAEGVKWRSLTRSPPGRGSTPAQRHPRRGTILLQVDW